MIRFEYDGFQISYRRKGYHDVNNLKWNIEIEPFVAQWVAQREEDTHVVDKRRSQAILRCCWKGKVLLSTRVKASKRKGH